MSALYAVFLRCTCVYVYIINLFLLLNPVMELDLSLLTGNRTAILSLALLAADRRHHRHKIKNEFL